MDGKQLIIFSIIGFSITFTIALGICIATTYLYNLISYGADVVEWETSLRFAVLMGIILPIVLIIQRVRKR